MAVVGKRKGFVEGELAVFSEGCGGLDRFHGGRLLGYFLFYIFAKSFEEGD
jgi:hypothetical protein